MDISTSNLIKQAKARYTVEQPSGCFNRNYKNIDD